MDRSSTHTPFIHTVRLSGVYELFTGPVPNKHAPTCLIWANQILQKQAQIIIIIRTRRRPAHCCVMNNAVAANKMKSRRRRGGATIKWAAGIGGLEL